MEENFPIEEIRKDFPYLLYPMRGKPLIYFDSAATTQKLRQVVDALSDFYLKSYGTVHRGVYERSIKATDLYQASRERIAQFINAASPNEIIITKGTTASINLVVSSLGKDFFQEGDEIILTEMEHHSNIVPWQMLAKEKKLILHFVPFNDKGELILDAYKKMLSPRVKFVSVAHVANSTGTMHPIEEMIKLAHEIKAKVLIDGAQAIAHLPVDVQRLDADFYAFSGHKIYGPTGIGVLYGKEALLQDMPPIEGGGDMIREVTLEKTLFQEPPLKFEAGTPPIAEVIALKVAIDYIESIGREKIQKREHLLLEYATEKLNKIPSLRIIGTAEKKSAIISFVVEGVHHLDLATFLDLEGIAIRSGHHCAMPTMQRFGVSGTCRVSFGIYSTLEEIDFFVGALNKVIADLRTIS